MDVGAELIGRYRLSASLGGGGMGEVWVGMDLKLDREVAVKLLPGRFGVDSPLASRFHREAKVAAVLQHPGITTIFDYGQHQRQLFLVMEYLDGEDLAKVLDRSPNGLPLDKVLDFGQQIAEALSAAHAKHVVHRDIKPNNLILTGRRIKICDFGIARFLDSTRMTSMGSAIGTPSYMAPEQIKDGAVDQRADLYSFGCVLFEMLTGTAPFSSENGVHALMHQHLHVPPPSARKLQRKVPAELDDLLMEMLAKQPEYRPPTAEEVGERLAAVEAGVVIDDVRAEADWIIEEARSAAVELRNRAQSEIESARKADLERRGREQAALDNLVREAEQRATTVELQAAESAERRENDAEARAAELIENARREAEQILKEARKSAETSAARVNAPARRVGERSRALFLATEKDVPLGDQKEAEPTPLLARKTPPSDRELEQWAESLDQMTPSDAARKLSTLAKEWHPIDGTLAGKRLDLLGTKKAREIRAAMLRRAQ